MPHAGDLRLGPVHLGAGRPVVARGRGAGGPAAIWITDERVPAPVFAWWQLVQQFPSTGLWPLLLNALDDGSGRPWDGDFDPSPLDVVDALDPHDVLARGWSGSLVPIDDPWSPGTGPLAPFGPEFPGLAPFGPVREVSAFGLPPGVDMRIGLVSCMRAADAIALIGWQGAVNVRTAAEVAAVLRTWEDRFGAHLVGLGFATMTLLVTRPPTDDDHALHVAAEVAALCPDALWQPESSWPYEEREPTLRALSQALVRRPVWRLWFD